MKKAVKNIITITALTTAGIHIANRLIERSATEKNILTTNNGHFFDWKHGRIFYTKKGTGEPIVLIHDLSPDSSAFEWNKIINNLSKDFTVYAIDLLGCGRSDKPAINYTGFLYVQLLNDFISKIVRKPSYVVATEFASPFTVMASFIEPGNYKKIIYINPTSPEEFDILPQEKKSIGKKLFDLPIIGTYLYNLSMSRNSLSQDFCDSMRSKDILAASDLVDASYEGSHLQGGNGRFLYSSLWDEYLNVNVRKGLMEHNVPMFIIESSEVADDENLLEQYRFYNKDITGTIIKNAKYMPQIEEPRKTSDEIRKFFS